MRPSPSPPRAIALVFALLPALSSAAPVTVKLEAPRDFGYVIGDLITHRIAVSAPPSFTLVQSHLPRTGPVAPWLDVRGVTVEHAADPRAAQYHITVTYQVLKGVREPVKLTIPALLLRFQDAGTIVEAEVPAWGFSYAPLIPPDTPDDAVDPRPPLDPVPLEVTPHLRSLTAIGIGTALVLLYLAWFYDRLPFLDRHPGPFARAARHIAALRRDPAAPGRYRRALEQFHGALNATAGETVFAAGLPAFYARHPRYAALRQPTERFFQHSRSVFFGDASDPNGAFPLAEVERLCRQYRSIERSPG